MAEHRLTLPIRAGPDNSTQIVKNEETARSAGVYHGIFSAKEARFVDFPEGIDETVYVNCSTNAALKSCIPTKLNPKQDVSREKRGRCYSDRIGKNTVLQHSGVEFHLR